MIPASDRKEMVDAGLDLLRKGLVDIVLLLTQDLQETRDMYTAMV